ncbi:efflux RND transporter permease subunit [Lentzea aerocolonigenes]|uniref:efflux RND transporter permease subunit n=1 Tax=Lentzea aerocolonigenes TaxID=68170 RepID=UPI0004C42022|nr:efflux RND transporter permease subunit [Lentzea aerocolonigenes]MCP2241920.1 Cu/Ag efflux pump CusA [Lentzea aerocolonigenes]
MMRWIVGSSQRYRRLVLAVAVALIALGFVQLRDSNVEALPEFGPVRVDVQVEALGLSAEEVENLITNPMENEFFNGIPWLAKLESRTIPGLSSMEMTFEPGTDPIRARQVVQERLTMVPALPAASSRPPLVIQPLSSTGRLMMIGLSSTDKSLIDMSLLSRWTVVPRLLSVKGVANVAIWGFRDRQLQVQVDPSKLAQNAVTLDQVLRTSANALWVSPLTFVEASTPGLGGFVDTANQRIEIQHNQPIKSAAQLGQVTVQGAEDRGLKLTDVATITEDHQIMIGDAVVNDSPSLMLVVERFPGSSLSEVTANVEAALNDLRPALPGVRMDTSVYRPASFIDTMKQNLVTTLLVGALLLLLVVFAFLFHWRAALTVLLSIAASVAVTALVLNWFGTPLNMMTIAGLVMALAVVVDDAVVAVDNVRQRLRDGEPTSEAIADAVVEMRGPLFVATCVTVVSVAPLLILDGVRGAFLTPVAVGFLVAIGVSMLVALTVAPVLATVLLTKGHRASPFALWLEKGYAALLGLFLRVRLVSWAFAAVLLIAGLAVTPLLGGHPLAPTLQERDVLVTWEAVPGTSRPEMNRITSALTKELRGVSGVRNVGAHTGRAMAGDQIVNINASEVWLSLDDRAGYDSTLNAVRDVVDGYPGIRGNVITYSDRQVRDVISRGSTSDVVVRIYGHEYSVLNDKAAEVLGILRGIDGISDPRINSTEVQPTLEIEVSVEKAAKYGLKPGDVRRQSATLVAATVAGNLFEDSKVFEVVVWGRPELRQNPANIRDLLIDAPVGGPEGGPAQVKLSDVAEVRVTPKPAMITHDSVSRSIDVVANVSGRSLADVTRDVSDRVKGVSFPREHHLEVLGESQARASTDLRIWLYIAGAVILVYFLLQAGLRSWRLATTVFLLLPVALSGGLLAAATQRAGLSVVALLGLLAVLAVAVRGALVQLNHYELVDGDVARGSRERFTPAVTSMLATALALVPLIVWGAVAGLEIVAPLALIVLGGLVTTAVVNLLVLPALYPRLAPKEKADA